MRSFVRSFGKGTRCKTQESNKESLARQAVLHTIQCKLWYHTTEDGNSNNKAGSRCGVSGAVQGWHYYYLCARLCVYICTVWSIHIYCILFACVSTAHNPPPGSPSNRDRELLGFQVELFGRNVFLPIIFLVEAPRRRPLALCVCVWCSYHYPLVWSTPSPFCMRGR